MPRVFNWGVAEWSGGKGEECDMDALVLGLGSKHGGDLSTCAGEVTVGTGLALPLAMTGRFLDFGFAYSALLFVALAAGCGMDGEKRFAGQTITCGSASQCDSELEYCYVAEPKGVPDTPTDHFCQEYPEGCESCDCLVDPRESFYSCEEGDSGITVTLHGF